MYPIFSLDNMASLVSADVDTTISEDQLRQIIERKMDELLSNGGVDEKITGFSRSDVLLLCSELKYSPFSEKITEMLFSKVALKLEHQDMKITKENEQKQEHSDTSTDIENEINKYAADVFFHNPDEFFDYLSMHGETFLDDRGTGGFSGVEKLLAEETPIFRECTEETMDGLIALAEKELSKEHSELFVKSCFITTMINCCSAKIVGRE